MKDFSQQYDVLVAGGGPAGVCAAAAAARQGARTALVERYGILGGMLTSGYVNPILGSVAPGSMYDEIIALLGATDSRTRNGREMSIDSEQAKGLFLQFVCEAGVDVFLQTPVVEVVKEGSAVKGLVVGTQEGLQTLYADVVVDATGDGFVAARAGAEFRMGRESDGRCQPTSIEFSLDGVDEADAITCWGGSDPVTLPDGTRYADLCKEANRRGELPPNVTIVRIHRTNRPGERSINATQANGYNTLTPEGVLGAEREIRGQIGQIIAFLRKYVPGYAQCKLKGSGSTLGVRETRRIMGDYVISDHDVETGTRQPDAVVHNAWFLIDIHNPSGGGQAEGRSQPAIPYDIPYRSMLPKGLDNLLTSGRCISGTHRAHASYRIGGVCLATGQAAGTAAALAALGHVKPRDLDVRNIQDALIKSGADLFDRQEAAPLPEKG